MRSSALNPTLILWTAVAALCGAGPAFADGTPERWAVSGSVDGKNFTLDCRFDQAGPSLTGACTDGPTGEANVPGGRSHPLVEGRAVWRERQLDLSKQLLALQIRREIRGRARR